MLQRFSLPGADNLDHLSSWIKNSCHSWGVPSYNVCLNCLENSPVFRKLRRKDGGFIRSDLHRLRGSHSLRSYGICDARSDLRVTLGVKAPVGQIGNGKEINKQKNNISRFRI